MTAELLLYRIGRWVAIIPNWPLSCDYAELAVVLKLYWIAIELRLCGIGVWDTIILIGGVDMRSHMRYRIAVSMSLPGGVWKPSTQVRGTRLSEVCNAGWVGVTTHHVLIHWFEFNIAVSLEIHMRLHTSFQQTTITLETCMRSHMRSHMSSYEYLCQNLIWDLIWDSRETDVCTHMRLIWALIWDHILVLILILIWDFSVGNIQCYVGIVLIRQGLDAEFSVSNSNSRKNR